MSEGAQIKPEELKYFIPLNTAAETGLKKLLPDVELVRLASGVVLFKKGDQTQQHFYLVSGKLQLDDEEGDKEFLQSGSSKAKFPIAHQFPRKVTATTSGPVVLYRIESQKVGEALSNKSSSDDIEVSELEEEGADDDWMTQLLRSRVFQLIPPSNIQRVMMCMEEQAVKAGEVIIRQGDEGDYFYLINRGHCRVERDMGDGQPPTELAILGPGVSVGEDALLAGNKRSATVTMIEDGRLLRLSKENFVELIREPVTKLHKPFGYQRAKDEVAAGAIWVDVREADEFERGHLVDAINLPFSILRFQATELDPAADYIVCCQDGRSSHAAAYLLTEMGIKARVLDKGLQMVPAGEFDQGPSSRFLEVGLGDDLDAIDKATNQESGQAEKLKLALVQFEAEIKALEQKRLSEVAALNTALDQARDDHSMVLAELLELKKTKASNGDESQELAEAKAAIDRLKAELNETRQALKSTRRELEEGDEALREQVRGYLEEKLQLEEEVEKLRKSQQGAAKGPTGNRELNQELDRLRKELAQTELALDVEVSARLEIEEELEKLKAGMA
jgi:CRP-like cAMP-binding protein/rhodanese-related sulfurtransferase